MSRTIMFYNLENLYDTLKDPNTDDGEFTPSGEKRWTRERYHTKLANLSEVIEAVAKSATNFWGRDYPAVIGVSEVENIAVMKELAAQPKMAPARYECVHYESNDARGVDVGAFYRPDLFEMMGSEPVKLVLRSGREYIGRDILAMWGKMDGEMYLFYICHWLSRRAGVDASAGFRRAGAETVRDHAAEMARRYKGIKVVIMGDMNDNPTDDSLAILLKARRDIDQVKEGEYYNPFWRLYERGQGSSRHFNRWVMYDNIIVSHNLCRRVESAGVFRRRFMLYKGNPKRCYCGNAFHNGYSDHLPVVVSLKMEAPSVKKKTRFNIMKRVFIALALIASLIGCTREEGVVKKSGEGNDVLQADLELVESTRVTLKNGTDVVWTSGDQITVVGTASTTFTLYAGAGTTRGKFNGDIASAGTSPYFAIFPCSDNAAFAEGAVSFDIAKNRGASVDNIKSNILPMISEVKEGSLSFHNLFGLLKITLTSSTDVKIKKMTLHDLGGNMLWGRCTVPILADTLSYSRISLSGGDNSTSIVWSTSATVTSTAKSFYFCVPPGALDRGFSIVLYEYDASAPEGIGRAYTFIQKISSPVAAERSVIIDMDASAISEKGEPLDEKARGYYKSIFVNGGVGINHLVDEDDLPWIKSMGLENDIEYISVSNTKERDSLTGLGLMVSAPLGQDATWNDQNGVLLYPDGKPRFRAVYVNGGSSTRHGRYLGQEGRDRFHDFYYNGGSYLASCAGTFLATKYVDGVNSYNNKDESKNFTFGIWPGELYHTKMPVSITTYGSIYTAVKATCDFGDFAAGDTVEMVRHHGGSYLPNTVYSSSLTPQPERLFSYQYTQDPSAKTDSTRYTYYNMMNYDIFGAKKTKRDSTCVWAYKNAPSTGRAVLCGSHPESNVSKSQIKLMSNMMDYALAGGGSVTVKDELELGVVRQMNTDWSDGTPAYAKIGDRQYHHFIVSAPDTLEDFSLTLDSDKDASSGINLYLALRKDAPAWLSDADFILCNKGGKKQFNIKALPPGTWYVSVYCATTVTASKQAPTSYLKFFKYSGKTETLDGIAYSIKAQALSRTAGSLSDFTGEQIIFNNNRLDD